MIPPRPGQRMVDTEGPAIAMCTKRLDEAPKAGILPKGFIASAHFTRGKGSGQYVQVTGMLDITKFNMSSEDRGGQYDNEVSRGSRAHPYRHFVSLIEPNLGIFCIRSCQRPEDCDTKNHNYIQDRHNCP
ncbi:hypothetical protein BGX28_003665 [Mortierella sp. GBA30]|nr:hypothetical protein BGX28_003665 [Mortierella sp. GBA30]